MFSFPRFQELMSRSTKIGIKFLVTPTDHQQLLAFPPLAFWVTWVWIFAEQILFPPIFCLILLGNTVHYICNSVILPFALKYIRVISDLLKKKCWQVEFRVNSTTAQVLCYTPGRLYWYSACVRWQRLHMESANREN